MMMSNLWHDENVLAHNWTPVPTMPLYTCTLLSANRTKRHIPAFPPSPLIPFPVSGTQPNLFPSEHNIVPRKTSQWHRQFKFRRTFRILRQPESNFWVSTLISCRWLRSEVTLCTGVCFQHVARHTALDFCATCNSAPWPAG